MHACDAKNMNEALKHNSFVFFCTMLNYNLLLLLLLWPKKLIRSKTSLRIWQPVKMFILGSLESTQAVHNRKWNWQSWYCSPGDINLVTWIWHNSTWQNSPWIFHSLGHVARCPILHCYVIKSIFALKPVFISFNFVMPTHFQASQKIFHLIWRHIRRDSLRH